MVKRSTSKPRRKPGPKPKPEGAKRCLASFKGSEEFRAWMEDFAAFKRLSHSALLEHALVYYAAGSHFRTPPPAR